MLHTITTNKHFVVIIKKINNKYTAIFKNFYLKDEFNLYRLLSVKNNYN